MKDSSLTPISLVPLLMSVFSLVSMIGLLQIDKIIRGTMYSYGLEFSIVSAQSYFRMTTLIFAMSWFNIISALVFLGYVLTLEKREARMFADAVRDEVMRTRIRAAEIIREATEAKPIRAQQKPKEATSPAPSLGATQKATHQKEPEAQTVTQGDSSKETPAPTPADQQAEQFEQPKEQPTQPQQKEPEPQPQQNETKPEITEEKEETPIIVGVPEEELNAAA